MSSAAGSCPHVVQREVMHMWWDDLTFIHFEVDPSKVEAVLPRGLRVDTIDDRTWVGLVPFHMRVGFPGGRRIPVFGSFHETNVRVYVRGPEGVASVWFCSLEASDAVASATARLGYGLPYCWADMTIERRGATGAPGTVITYESRRRLPGPRGAHHRSVVRVGDPIAASDVSPVEHFLSARWGLYSTWMRRLIFAPVEHAPWRLHRAELQALDDELLDAAGLAVERDAVPLVHWTPGTSIRIGRPRRSRPSPPR